MKQTILALTAALMPFLATQSMAEEATTETPSGSEKLQERKEQSQQAPWWGGWEAHLMQPSVRMYFDVGSDDADEIDIYNDGSLVPTLNFLELYRPIFIDEFLLNTKKEFTVGPTIGFGITAPAEDSEDGTEEADDAPVLLLSVGALASVELNDNVSIGVESGWALGLSADEGVSDISDSALYVGLVLNLKFD